MARSRSSLLLALLAVGGTGSVAFGSDDAARREFFEERIRPVLAVHCSECHGAARQDGGLRVDWRDGLRKGGDSGPAVEPGNPDDSLLVRVMEHDEPGLEMPRKAPKLPDTAIGDFRSWVASGAFDPREAPPLAEQAAEDEWRAKLAQRRSWWSLQPVGRPPVPEPRDGSWALGPPDRFVLLGLEAEGLRPAPPADRAVLARRLAFVLTGLPPDADLLDDFLADPDPGAYERLVDRLLASPHFGEHWARHWMDAVRYGDTYGYEWDIPAKGAWRYRDYLVRAFNADVPFDQLIREQIAGDLLETPRIDPAEGIVESLVGPMFFQLGEKRHGDSAEFDGIHQEMLQNKIDAFSKAFLGLTVGCARCHDHKLDAISQRDYYALAGVFMSPRWVSRTLDTPDRNAGALAELRRLKGPLREELASWWLEESGGWAETILGSSAAPEAAGAWKTAVDEAGAEPGWEHPLRAWVALVDADRSGGDVAGTWTRIASEYAAERSRRVAENAAKFRVIADFSGGVPPGWSAEGEGLRDGPVRPGDFTVALEGEAAVGAILPGGLFTNALSPRLNGAIRSPLFRDLPEPWLSWESCGGDFAAERTVVDNAFLTERQVYLSRRDPAWSGYPPFPEFAGRRVYRELATKSSNPNFPPRVGLGGPCSDEQAADPSSWFGVTRAIVGREAGAPIDELARFTPLFEAPPPETLADAARCYADWLRSSIDRWSHDQATNDDATLMNWLLDRGLLPNRGGDGAPSSVRELVADYRRAERAVLDPRTVNGMAELDAGEDYPLNIRGDYARLGPAVPRGFLEVLSKGGEVLTTGAGASGRLEVADRVASADNPLTARVYVNRLWQWVFGVGLVATPDDFGKLGDPPSHPELLDWLASRFVEEGWSTKRLVRELVLSASFRQGSVAVPEARSVDPMNRLLHHYPLRRLEAESLRDAILAASGRLDRRLGGPPIDPHRANEDAQKRLVSGPIDGLGRRSLYTKLTVMEPPRFLALFNQPPPKIPTGRRDVTNVPAQALALLNDPFVIGQASVWGERLAADLSESVEGRLHALFLEGLGRPPTRDELARWSTLMDDLARRLGTAPDHVATSPELWADVAHTMINTKEFLYVR